jgi:hypothetical protein
MPQASLWPPPEASEYRIVDLSALRASRCTAVFTKAKGQTNAAKSGLRYEKRVARELVTHATRGHFHSVEHNPWFTFDDSAGTGNCSPDFIVWPDADEPEVLVIEVKLTWVEVAVHKLLDLYCPVVCAALGVRVQPLIICRNVSPASPPAKHTLREAMASCHALLHWPDNGHILW